MVDSLAVLSRVMDFQSAMETFAEAWVAANVTQVNIKQFKIKKSLRSWVLNEEKFFSEKKCTKYQQTAIEQFTRTWNKQHNKKETKGVANSKIYLMFPFTPEPGNFREVQKKLSKNLINNA